MEKNSTKLFLEVDASHVDVKQLLKKDFLELSMRAISSANPNRNNSWFTRESMEKSIDSFVNKPILGYFENGDFVSHNGDWSHDSETEMDYWDTLGKKGERILGIIRESDQVQIVEDGAGLSWITFTCALWTQYSFKQVKRLIKDAKRAQQNGGATKNISVEVDITDYDILDNGVMKINEFNLVGVTILGTRNGMKVEPGIENAELSVVDIIGRDVYSKQEKSLRLAYEKLDNPVNKEEESQMEMENVKETESVEVDQSLDTSAAFSNAEDQPQDDIHQPEEAQDTDDTAAEHCESDACPECGQNPCVCESTEPEQCAAEDSDETSEEDESAHCAENDEDQDKGEDDTAEEPEDDGHESACGKYGSYEELSALYEAEVQKTSDLAAQLEAKTAVITDYEAKIASYEHSDFMKKVSEFLASAQLDDEVVSQFTAQCEASEINSIEDLKIKVAVYSFDNRKTSAATVSFTAPISNPDVSAAFSDKSKSKNKSGDHWSELREYIKK